MSASIIDPKLVASPDPVTRVILLEVPTAQVVLFQGFFENFEGLGCVRTLDPKGSLIGVYTTKELLNECAEALAGIAGVIPWRQTSVPAGVDLMSFAG